MRFVTMGLVVTLFASNAGNTAPVTPATTSPPTADLKSDRDLLAALRAQIKGREKEPAESVFTNIQILKGKPAAAVLSIMDIGYNTSLGVACSYCHEPSDWASDVKAGKRAARRMSAMVHDINEKYLPAIDGLESENPVVNCTTCHRGHKKPALDLEPAASASH